MPFSRCQDVIERVSSVLDGEASLVARVRFHCHLAMCASCRRYYHQLAQVRAAAGVVRPEDVPEDFDRVMGFVLDALPPARGVEDEGAPKDG